MFLSEMTPGSEEDSPLYDRISITGASTGGGDGQEYDDVKPLSKEGQPAGIELTPYLAVKSAATTGMENNTGGGDGQAYDEVKPLSKEGQPAGIEFIPCPAYLAVKSAATSTGMENNTGGGDGQEYDDVKPLSKEGQPAGIELTPCPAYLAVKSAATTGMENNMDETEYELPDNVVAAGTNQGPTDPTQH